MVVTPYHSLMGAELSHWALLRPGFPARSIVKRDQSGAISRGFEDGRFLSPWSASGSSGSWRSLRSLQALQALVRLDPLSPVRLDLPDRLFPLGVLVRPWSLDRLFRLEVPGALVRLGGPGSPSLVALFALRSLRSFSPWSPLISCIAFFPLGRLVRPRDPCSPWGPSGSP